MSVVNSPRKKGIKVGIGYEVDKNIKDLKIDSMVLMLDKEGKLISESFFIFYNNLKSPDNSVEHLGNILLDSKDPEQIIVDTSKASDLVKRIIFIINIADADKKTQDFSSVRNLYIRFTNLETKEEIAEYFPQKDGNFNKSNIIALSEFILIDDEWQIQALGEGFKVSLSEFIELLSNNYSYDKFKDEYYKLTNHNSYSIKSAIENELEDKYLKLLEADKNTSNDEIKRKYKELVKSFHPDIIQTKNLHKDIVEFANNRFKEIKQAYDFIKTKRNF